MKNKKNKKLIKLKGDELKHQRLLIEKIYNTILNLDTKTLQQHSLEVYKELISRQDYLELQDIVFKYQLLQDELMSRGVNLECLK